MQTSSVTQETSNVFGFVSKLGRCAFDLKLNNLNSEGYPCILPNFLYFDGFGSWVGEKKPKVVASLSLNSKCSSSFRRILSEYNKAIRFHCERIPLGFASLGNVSEENNGLSDNGSGVLEGEGLPLNGIESDNPKKVLILMSDTGGGHRASAEAIKAAFNEEFGDEYQVFVTDLWTDHTPWPFNQLPRSYNFLVKHGPLWKMTYYASAPRLVHQSNFAATSTFIARLFNSLESPLVILNTRPLLSCELPPRVHLRVQNENFDIFGVLKS